MELLDRRTNINLRVYGKFIKIGQNVHLMGLTLEKHSMFEQQNNESRPVQQSIIGGMVE